MHNLMDTTAGLVSIGKLILNGYIIPLGVLTEFNQTCQQIAIYLT